MVTIRIAEGRLELQAPYHPVLPFRSKQIGGKWLGADIGWVFPLEEEQALRRVCLDIWAVDGSPAALDETVNLHIAVDERAPVRSVFVAYQSPNFPGRPGDCRLPQKSTWRGAGQGRQVFGGKTALRLFVKFLDDHHPQRVDFHHPRCSRHRR